MVAITVVDMGTALTAAEARRAALHAQGLLGAPRSRSVPTLLRSLGAIQLDTISVLARSQELVPFARLGAVGRPAVHQAFWEPRGPGSARTFEYWAHAACVLPAEDWPLFAFRRRSYRNRNDMWGMAPDSTSVRGVLDRLAADGPLTTNELGGARKTPGWWDWSEVKQAVEYLLACGRVVCVERRGWRRVYDLPERALPERALHDELTDRQCQVELVTRAGRALGVGTRSDLLDYYRLKNVAGFADVAYEAGLEPVEVEGWGQQAWAAPTALEFLAAGGRGRHRTTLLSPFDSLIWERARTERMFGLSHRLEAYVPKPKRVHGYYAMPLLHGGELLGRVDPARERSRDGEVLIARQVSLEKPRALEPMVAALREAAAWVGCTAIRVESVVPEGSAEPLRRAVDAVEQP
ncbi:YcaQ family DNA glycosylase [Actinospica durhamensis]|uniref:YcaQ family DNA glycosylase n=2 Tax=Actinospica durhamensis TaxID=1508375 RepID=A0A941EVP1_9ACTN|nr:YcaQ family DNA glycosylase [Actinospica durhamensis]